MADIIAVTVRCFYHTPLIGLVTYMHSVLRYKATVYLAIQLFKLQRCHTLQLGIERSVQAGILANISCSRYNTPQYGRNGTAHAAGASMLSPARGVFAGMRSVRVRHVCGVRWALAVTDGYR